jgi:hypothetical protein
MMIFLRCILLFVFIFACQRAIASDDPLRDKLKEKMIRYCGTAQIGYVYPGFHSAQVGGGVARVKQVGRHNLSGQHLSLGFLVGSYAGETVLAPGLSYEYFRFLAGFRITPRYFTNFSSDAFGLTVEAGLSVFGRISVYFGRTFVSNNASLFPFKYRNTLSVAIHFYQPREKRKWFGK